MATQTTITRKIEFDAGHRLLGHESKCARLHGHRYVAEFTVMANELDSVGRVIDFSIVKERLKEWIDFYWDHNMILHENDPLLGLHEGKYFSNKTPFVMPMKMNPTAENMAKVLFMTAERLLKNIENGGLRVVQVKLYETPNCWAVYTELMHLLSQKP